MINSVKKQFMYRLNELGQMSLILGGTWLAGFILSCGVVVFCKTNDYANIGILIMMMIGALILTFSSSISSCVDFELAVRMSQPRKKSLVAMLIIDALHGLAYTAIIAVLAILDKFLASAFFKNISMEESFMEIINLKSMLYIFLGCMCMYIFGIFFGALLQRFGKVAFWIIYALYMLAIFGTSSVSSLISKRDTSSFMGKLAVGAYDMLSAISADGVIVLAVALVLTMLAIGFIMLSRAAIKN